MGIQPWQHGKVTKSPCFPLQGCCPLPPPSPIIAARMGTRWGAGLAYDITDLLLLNWETINLPIGYAPGMKRP
jgi:hypothetical protein